MLKANGFTPGNDLLSKTCVRVSGDSLHLIRRRFELVPCFVRVFSRTSVTWYRNRKALYRAKYPIASCLHLTTDVASGMSRDEFFFLQILNFPRIFSRYQKYLGAQNDRFVPDFTPYFRTKWFAETRSKATKCKLENASLWVKDSIRTLWIGTSPMSRR